MQFIYELSHVCWSTQYWISKNACDWRLYACIQPGNTHMVLPNIDVHLPRGRNVSQLQHQWCLNPVCAIHAFPSLVWCTMALTCWYYQHKLNINTSFLYMVWIDTKSTTKTSSLLWWDSIFGAVREQDLCVLEWPLIESAFSSKAFLKDIKSLVSFGKFVGYTRSPLSNYMSWSPDPIAHACSLDHAHSKDSLR